MGEDRKLHNRFHSLYSSPNIGRVIESRMLKWVGSVDRMEDDRSIFVIFAGRSTGKKPLGRSRRRWEGNVGIDVKEIDVCMRNLMNSFQDREYWSICESGIELQGSISHGFS
jgi:hypothetical protein